MKNYDKACTLLNLALLLQEPGEGVSLDDIQEEYKVSRRTAERMLNSVREMFTHIELMDNERDDRIKRWRIRQRSVKTNSLISFTSEELAVFKTAISALKRQNKSDSANILRNVEAKVKHLINERDRHFISSTAQEMMKLEGWALRPGPEIVIDEEILSKLMEAMQDRGPILSRDAIPDFEAIPFIHHQIEVEYLSRSTGRVSRSKLMPYGILYGERDHYLLARRSDAPSEEDVHLYILNNIKNVEILPDTYKIPKSFNLEEFAKRSFGVYQEEPFEVEWLFDKKKAPEAKNYIFHPTQEMTENPDGTLTVKFKAGGMLEMDWHLYTWGNHVKVIKPEDWYEKIAEKRKSL
jgi:predicted DNA-binding transcriptional regulator YafY